MNWKKLKAQLSTLELENAQLKQQISLINEEKANLIKKHTAEKDDLEFQINQYKFQY